MIVDNVNLVGLRPELAPILLAAEAAHAEHGEEARLTSAVRPTTRPRRSSKSQHPVGLAADFGLRLIRRDRWELIYESLRLRLASCPTVDVVFEPDAAGGPHIHVEIDP